MRLNSVGQLLLAFALGLIAWTVITSTFGKWTVLAWFEKLTPIDVMFLILLGLVGLLTLGGGDPPQRSAPGSGRTRTRTIW